MQLWKTPLISAKLTLLSTAEARGFKRLRYRTYILTEVQIPSLHALIIVPLAERDLAIARSHESIRTNLALKFVGVLGRIKCTMPPSFIGRTTALRQACKVC